MANRPGRKALGIARRRETRNRFNRKKYKSEKYRYFEQVLEKFGLWQPPKVERT